MAQRTALKNGRRTRTQPATSSISATIAAIHSMRRVEARASSLMGNGAIGTR